MRRALCVVGALALLALAGCVSKGTYEAKVGELTAELEAANTRGDVLTGNLRSAERAGLELREELEDREAMVENLETAVARSISEVDALRTRMSRLELSLANALDEVPGVIVGHTGQVKVTVPFALGGVDLGAAPQQTVRKVGKALARHEGLVYVDGHSDSMPVAQPETRRRYVDNLGLSVARGASVARALVAEGVAAERLVVRGFGSAQPIAPNDTRDGRAKNRRVEIRFVPGLVAEEGEIPEADLEALEEAREAEGSDEPGLGEGFDFDVDVDEFAPE